MIFSDYDLKEAKSNYRQDSWIKALLTRLEAKENLCKAVGLYKKECENPASDAIYKRTLRNRMFELYGQWCKAVGK